MKDTLKPDWDPRSETVIRDQRAAYDAMRKRCPVAFSDYLQWSLFRHEDVVRVLNDPAAFSNAASQYSSSVGRCRTGSTWRVRLSHWRQL